MKKLLAALLLVASFSANAAVQIDTSGLTESQKAELVQRAEAMKVTPTATVDKIDEWVNLGERIGKMFGGAAKEIGVAANEFVATPVGKWTMALIIYKVAGTDLLKIVGAFTLLFATWAAARKLRLAAGETVEYDLAKPNWFGNYPVKSIHRGEAGEGLTFGIYAMYALGIIGCFATLINI